MFAEKKLLLIITGGIAAYKALELIRLLRRQDVQIKTILTHGGGQFVTPLSVAGVSHDTVYTDLFSLTDELEMGHIALSRWADAVLVAPCSADFMAKMAHGLADDLATTAMLATNKPVILAPAMNVQMWHHAATQANLATLKQRGITIIPPNEGSMACGEWGIGRLPEATELLQHLEHFFNADKPLSGKTALVTSGATYEPLDPVRFIGNHSSGKQGHAIAAALAAAGADVRLIHGHTRTPVPAGVTAVFAPTAQAMLDASLAALPVDMAVYAAAVSDWYLPTPSVEKMKKQADIDTLSLVLQKTPDILATIAQHPTLRPRLVIGFAAETHSNLEVVEAKRARKHCDWLLYNQITADTPRFGEDCNQVALLVKGHIEPWPLLPKTGVASRLVDHIIKHFAEVSP